MNRFIKMVLSAGSERGQALIFIVFIIIGLLGATALAIDGGSVFVDRSHAQNTADSAALAAGLSRIRGGSWQQTGLAAAASNGYDNNGETNQVEIRTCNSSGVDCGKYSGNPEYIKLTLTSLVRMTFAQVIGRREITNRVESIVRTKPAEYKEMYEGNAVVSLVKSSDCLVKKAFYLHGEATLQIWGSGIFVNSGNDTCAFIQEGSGSLYLETEGTKITLVGKDQVQKPKLISPYPPQIGAIQVDYPPPFYMPNVGCSQEAKILEDGQTMSPGSWGNEDFPPEDVNSLEAGMYCLGGDFIVEGGETLGGSNIVIEMKWGKVNWSGNAEIDLRGRKAGDLAGLLLYLPPENHSRVVLNGNSKSRIQGAILAPGADVHLNGMDSDKGFHSQILGYRVEVNGNSIIRIRYQDEQNYDALYMPMIQLIE